MRNLDDAPTDFGGQVSSLAGANRSGLRIGHGGIDRSAGNSGRSDRNGFWSKHGDLKQKTRADDSDPNECAKAPFAKLFRFERRNRHGVDASSRELL
jgi:hypothetical protein